MPVIGCAVEPNKLDEVSDRIPPRQPLTFGRTKRGNEQGGNKQIKQNSLNDQKIHRHFILPLLFPPCHSPKTSSGL